MPKISELDYVSEIDATSCLLGIKGGEAVRIPASLLQGSDQVVNATFIGQTDTPATYADQAGKMAAVNATEDALEFIDAPTSLPAGGTAGQVLTKNSVTDGDASWAEASGGTEITSSITAPANPVNGQLWIDESQGVQDMTNFLDVTNFTSDYPLRRGETAVVNYAAATSVPLHIKTVEGIYEIIIQGDATVTPTVDSNINLAPNNASASNIVNYGSYYIESETAYRVTTSTLFGLSNQLLLSAIMKISTITKSKTVFTDSFTKRMSSQYTREKMRCWWNNTTTVWASLGTITFPFAQSGTIIIRRIY